MIVAGLTGSIAMGKSTVAAMMAENGCPVFDADAAVRDFYATDGVRDVESLFPGVAVDGRVDRQRLSVHVLNDSAAMRRLEGLVHPAVGVRRARFIAEAREARRRLIFLDVPLLFETGGDRSVDLSIVVSADDARQEMRALARPGMTRDKFRALLAQQMPDSEKRKRAHFVIDTNRDMQATRCEVRDLVRALAGMTGQGARYA